MILIRTEGNNKIGLGHLYRIKSIVDLIRYEIEYKILLDNYSNNEIFENDDNIVIINKNEIETLNYYYKINFKLIIIDGYSFKEKFQRNASKIGFKILLIDDLISNVDFVNVVINHSLEVKTENYKSSKGTTFYLGSKYALIRREFQKQHFKNKNLNAHQNIFINFGGSDPKNLTEKTFNIVNKIKNIDKIYILIGKSFNHELPPSLEKKENVILKKDLNADGIRELIDKSTIAIIPSSTILFEACSIGIPIITGHYMSNQKNIYKDFKKNKLVVGIGDLTKNLDEKLRESILKILSSENLRCDLIHNQRKFFDRKSSKRIKKIIKNLI